MKGHPIRGFIAGLLLGLVVDVDLFLGGVVESDSSTLVVVFIVCVVVVFLLGLWAPIGRRRKPKETIRPNTQPLPAPVAWPETAPIEGSTPPPPGWKAPPDSRPLDNPAWGRLPPQAPPADPGAPPAAPPPAPPPSQSI
jgi:hypothetical protein